MSYCPLVQAIEQPPKPNSDTLLHGDTPSWHEHRSQLRALLHRLVPGLELLSPGQYPLITDVLSLIDYAIRYNQQLWPAPAQPLHYYRRLLEQVLLELLQAPSGHTALLHHWGNLLLSAPSPTTLISTNCDLTLEQYLWQRVPADSIDVGFAWHHPATGWLQRPPSEPMFRLLKLHGATNLLHCQHCGHTYLNTFGSIVHQAFRSTLDDLNTCHCGHGPLRPNIIAPSLAREITDHNLPYVWQQALEDLRQANRWIIVGYSLPPEDLNIKTMLLRALHSRQHPPQIEVVQLGHSARPHYQALFGAQLCYHADGIEQYLHHHYA